MATNYEYVQFSHLAYQNTGTLMGWTRLEDSPFDPSGYHGAAFQNLTTNEIVVANRGTEITSIDDLYADYQMGKGKCSSDPQRHDGIVRWKELHRSLCNFHCLTCSVQET